MEPEMLSRNQTGWTERDDFVTFQNRFMVWSHSNRTEVCDGEKMQCLSFSLNSIFSHTSYTPPWIIAQLEWRQNKSQITLIYWVSKQSSWELCWNVFEDVSSHFQTFCRIINLNPDWADLIWRVFTGEHPRPIFLHSEVPTSRGVAVQVGPGDYGPDHMAEAVVFWDWGWRSCGMGVPIALWWICRRVILWGVVLLR